MSIRKLLLAILFPSFCFAANSSLTVSSGTFLSVDGFTAANSNFRQSITIADPSVTAGVATVDPVTGITVHLATSSATQNIYVINPTTTTVANSTTGVVGVGGTYNTSGSTEAVTNVSGQNLNVNVAAGSIANTGFNVNNSPSVYNFTQNLTTVTFNGSAQPVTLTSTIIQQSTAGVITPSGTGLVITSTYPINIAGSFTSTPPALTTVTFNGSAQPIISTGVPVLFLNNQNANTMGAVTNSNSQIIAISPSSNTVSVQVSTVGVIPANGFFNMTGSTVGITGSISSVSSSITTATVQGAVPAFTSMGGFVTSGGIAQDASVTASSAQIVAISVSSNTVTPSNTQTTQLYTYQTNPSTATVVASTMGVVPANGFFNTTGSTTGVVAATPLPVISTGVPSLFLNNQNANAMGAVTNSNAQIVAVSPSSNTVSVQVSTVGVIPASGFFNITGSTGGVTNGQSAPLFTYQTNPSTVSVITSTMGVIPANGFFNTTGSTEAVTVPSGTPLPIGVAVSSTALNTGLAQGTTIVLYGTTVGQLLTTGIPYQITATTFSLNVTAQAATDQVIISSPAAQSYNYVCGCAFNNSSATNAFVTLYQTTSAVNSGFDAMQIGVPANDVNAGVWPGCTNPFFRSKMGGQITLKASATATSTSMRCLFYVAP